MSKKLLLVMVAIISVISFFAGRTFSIGKNLAHGDVSAHTPRAQTPKAGPELSLPGDELPPPQSTLGIRGVAAFVVEDLSAGSPAEQAGLKPGDLIIWIDGNPVNSVTEVLKISRNAPGRKVELFVLRYNPGTQTREPITVNAVTAPLKAKD